MSLVRRPENPGGAHERLVLVVDDDEAIREALADIFLAEGYAIVTAAHGGEALAKLGKLASGPHVVLVDLMMPSMNGWDFVERLRALPEHGATPVLVLTARPDEDVRRPEWTHTTYLRKPIDVESLLAHVRRVSA
jgi:CheY-like chemotaxis protein